MMCANQGPGEEEVYSVTNLLLQIFFSFSLSVLFKGTKGKLMHFPLNPKPFPPFRYVCPLNLFTSGRKRSLSTIAYAAETTRETKQKEKIPWINSFYYCVCGRYNSNRFQYCVAAMIVIGVFVFQYSPPRPLIFPFTTLSPQ